MSLVSIDGGLALFSEGLLVDSMGIDCCCGVDEFPCPFPCPPLCRVSFTVTVPAFEVVPGTNHPGGSTVITQLFVACDWRCNFQECFGFQTRPITNIGLFCQLIAPNIGRWRVAIQISGSPGDGALVYGNLPLSPPPTCPPLGSYPLFAQVGVLVPNPPASIELST